MDAIKFDALQSKINSRYKTCIIPVYQSRTDNSESDSIRARVSVLHDQ